MEKQKEKDETQKDITEKTKHKQARQIVFLSLPHSVRKIQADFLSKRPHFSRLPPLFSLKISLPLTNSLSPYAQDTRLRVYTRSRSQRICHFCLHLTPQQTVYQPIEGEGNLCIHLHLHRNKLKINTLHHTDCKKQVKAKG